MAKNSEYVTLTDDGWTCFDEFDEHDDHSDCQRMFDTMTDAASAYDVFPDDWYADAVNREAEENILGRPLFPNEY